MTFLSATSPSKNAKIQIGRKVEQIEKVYSENPQISQILPPGEALAD